MRQDCCKLLLEQLKVMEDMLTEMKAISEKKIDTFKLEQGIVDVFEQVETYKDIK